MLLRDIHLGAYSSDTQYEAFPRSLTCTYSKYLICGGCVRVLVMSEWDYRPLFGIDCVVKEAGEAAACHQMDYKLVCCFCCGWL